jgi:hypothetical protein
MRPKYGNYRSGRVLLRCSDHVRFWFWWFWSFPILCSSHSGCSGGFVPVVPFRLFRVLVHAKKKQTYPIWVFATRNRKPRYFVGLTHPNVNSLTYWVAVCPNASYFIIFICLKLRLHTMINRDNFRFWQMLSVDSVIRWRWQHIFQISFK